MQHSKARRVPEERRLEIRNKIREAGVIHASDIAEAFGISTETVRRDFLVLEQRGQLRRLYGGAAQALENRAVEASFNKRQSTKKVQKRAMARLASQLIGPHDTVILDVGTSVAEVAYLMPETFRGRVLTNSIRVAQGLEQCVANGVEVFLAGGRLRPGDMALSGSFTDAFYRDFFADCAFLGSGGVHPERGLTDYNIDEISARRIIIEAAREVYVLADSSKCGQITAAKVCDTDAISAVITDDGISDRLRREFEDAGVKLLVASTDGSLDEADGGDVA